MPLAEAPRAVDEEEPHPKTIANLYKSRWQIELFFKWIKQHLKVKRFVGRTKNAVLSQLWVATCMYVSEHRELIETERGSVQTAF